MLLLFPHKIIYNRKIFLTKNVFSKKIYFTIYNENSF